MVCSVVISLLLLKEVSLKRSLAQTERNLGDAQESAATAAAYENAWRQLAVHVYQVGHDDPGLMAMLKSENIGINQGTGVGGGSVPVTLSPATPKSSGPTPVSPGVSP